MTPTSPRSTDKVLARVRALLAKAESTTFPEEAEALVAKAQELMARHAIDEAMATSRQGGGGPVLRHVVVPDPYRSAKTTLSACVAGANRVRVITTQSGQVTMVGFGNDVDVVELLFTSLLVQATAALHGVDAAARGGRTRAFRHAFLVAFAGRIAARLRSAAASAERSASATHGAALVPVLAARASAVDATVRDKFGPLRSKSASVSHRGGWLAGTAAADRADLGASKRVPAAAPQRAMGT